MVCRCSAERATIIAMVMRVFQTLWLVSCNGQMEQDNHYGFSLSSMAMMAIRPCLIVSSVTGIRVGPSSGDMFRFEWRLFPRKRVSRMYLRDAVFVSTVLHYIEVFSVFSGDFVSSFAKRNGGSPRKSDSRWIGQLVRRAGRRKCLETGPGLFLIPPG